MTKSIPFVEINGHKIGAEHPTYIVAELSANHRQDYLEAEKLVRAAQLAGADAVKLQTFTADTITMDCDAPCFRLPKDSLWPERTLHSLYSEAAMPWEWQPRLKALAQSLGIDLFSTPFDVTAVDFLEQMEVSAYKIASFEIVDMALIKRVAATAKPVIFSTGMASLGEIEAALNCARKAGAGQIVLLQCVSAYPADPREMNLKTLPHLATVFDVPCGLSDHSTGIAVPITAVALGASMIEKHFTLSRKSGSLDCAFSLEPDEFRQMVDQIRLCEQALGAVCFGPGKGETANLDFRRSLFVVRDIKKGECLTVNNIRSIRPGKGLSPRHYDLLLGKRVICDVTRGTPLSWGLIMA